MNEQVCSGHLIDPLPQWSLLFAKDVDQDLDFDEGLEDDELDQHKPPRRRPLLWILILLLAVGVVYWALQPDFSPFTSQDSSSDPISPPRITLPDTGQKEIKTLPVISVPIPLFKEGQKVLLVQQPGENTLSVTLLSNASGTQPGPLVKAGEILTILDGETVGEGWVYKVRTQSGATGWVSEKSIMKKTS
jgi:hypothetical protein